MAYLSKSDKLSVSFQGFKARYVREDLLVSAHMQDSRAGPYHHHPALSLLPTKQKGDHPVALFTNVIKAWLANRSYLLNKYILKLPWIAAIDVFGEQAIAIFEWCPIGVLTNDGSQVRHADIEIAAEIHFFRFDHAAVWIF